MSTHDLDNLFGIDLPIHDTLSRLSELAGRVYYYIPRSGALCCEGVEVQSFTCFGMPDHQAATRWATERRDELEQVVLRGSFDRTDYEALLAEPKLMAHARSALEPLAFMCRSGINPGSLLTLQLHSQDPAAQLYAPLLEGTRFIRYAENSDFQRIEALIPSAMLALVESLIPMPE